jgi:hypothetical protein
MLEGEMIRARALGLSILAAIASGSACAQSANASPAASEPVAYSSIHELNQLLDPLQQWSQTTQVDLAKLRIDRWKTDSVTKRQTQANVDSLSRNLHDALPDIVAGLKSSPENLAATFKLYRNLDALYDVFSSVTESAGAFGSKDEFQGLDNDLTTLEQSRRAVADRMANLATQKEGELAALHTEIQQMKPPAAAAAPANKVVVDDTAPPKKPVRHRAKPKSTPATPSQPSASQPAQAPASNPNQL